MLKDVLHKDLKIVFCGTAKGTASVTKGFYYAGSGNQFYKILFNANFTDSLLIPDNCYDIYKFGIGLTDLVHNQHGNDNEINESNYNVKGFIDKINKFKPKYIGFNGKKAASYVLGLEGKTGKVQYGLQTQKIKETKLFVLPSTSGSARKYWDEAYWKELATYII
ncbi:mismatch-specific DNA-glycosylase [Aureibaculum luteum]|uniref:mismatch-specific DNA-glycosylase n=1 Tax=Aureibaculum luteum TaxID=1548456 RepID=UPI000E471252|nr:mismatch-specific DNA-glycosylase [Aureibaculum luteum]